MRNVPDWTQNEFAELAKTILETVSSGGTVADGCRKYEEISQNLRSSASCRFKWNVRLSKEYTREYEWAKAQGAQVQQQNAQQRHSIVRGIGTHAIGDSDDNESKRITQRQLLRMIRDYTIVPDDYDELINDNERLRREAIEAKRELERVQRKLTLLEAKYGELQQENEKIMDAFNIARRQFTGVSAPSNVKMTIDKHGVLQQVKVED